MMKRIKDLKEIKRDRYYHVVVFCRFGVLTSAVLPGYDMAERMKEAKYEKAYDMFLFPDDPKTAYDIFEEASY